MMYEIKKSNRIAKARSDEFWQRENEANSVRRKDISELDYIIVPFDELPFSKNADQTIANYQSKILKLKDQKILNLTGYTNTDLKFMYGAANLNDLTEYDTNYTTLVSNLGLWIKALYDSDKEANHDDITTLAEYAISIGSDVSSTYKILAGIYLEDDKIPEIYNLLDKASDLNSLNKDVIVNNIKNLLES
ncbi:MAG: hypothetical protein K5656_07020 [Lachnospiraceae bacterium]|nr:hypothetical protein [Lachnospiraceae bacterium]